MLFIQVITFLSSFSLGEVDFSPLGKIGFFPQRDLVYTQVSEQQLEQTIQQRFRKYQDHIYSLPFLGSEEKAKLHAMLPSLSFEELVRRQVESREFRWVNRGNKIGVELNEDYYTHLKKKKGKDRNFVEITTVPKKIDLSQKNSGKVIVTYSFPKRVEGESIQPFAPAFLKRIQQSLSSNPYIDFVHVDEEKDGVKGAIRIIQLATSESDGEWMDLGFTETEIYPHTPILMGLYPQDSKEMMDTFLHELMHALGLPHHWDALFLTSHKNKSTTQAKEILSKDVQNYKEEWHTTYAQTLPDSCNEAYPGVRFIENQDIRAISGAILSVLYHLEDPYIRGVTFEFDPQKGQEFYHVEEQQNQDGSKLVRYKGRVAGITLSNPGSDFTDLNFSQVPAFPKNVPGGYSVKEKFTLYPKGVTAFLEPDANITFNTYLPQDRPGDKNVSIDLYTNLRHVYLSQHDDWAVISKVYQQAKVYPGLGNDRIQLNNKNQKVVIKQFENQDIIEASHGGYVMLGYKAEDLLYYKKDNDLYLIAFEPGKAKKVHGVCLRDYYKSDQQINKLVVQDALGKSIDIEAKKIPVLPEDINFFES